MSKSSRSLSLRVALVSSSLVACGGGGGGGTDAAVDAYVPPGVDAPTPTECMESGGRTFEVDVISAEGYPQPAEDAPALEGAAVRVAHRCGQIAEGTTDASGHARLTVDGPPRGWALTVARAGFSAVSVMDLDGSPEGPIRIDRMTPQAFTAVPVSGTVSGARDGARVLLDAYDFDTQELAGNGPWSAQLYTSEIDPPFFVAALEITDGHLTNLATTTIDPRPHTATTDVALTFGAAAETAIVSTYTVSGVEGATPVFASTLHYFGALDGAWVTPAAVLPEGNRVTVEHMPSLVPTHGFFTWDGAQYRTVAIVHDFTPGSHALTAPTAFGLGSLATFGGPFGAIGNGSGDVDALVIHIDEGEDHGPRWRVYCSPSLHTRDNPCNVPALPSSVTLADLGIGVSTRPSALVMMQTAHEGSLWSFPGVGFPSSRLDWQLASSYSDFDPNGTFAP